MRLTRFFNETYYWFKIGCPTILLFKKSKQFEQEFNMLFEFDESGEYPSNIEKDTYNVRFMNKHPEINGGKEFIVEYWVANKLAAYMSDISVFDAETNEKIFSVVSVRPSFKLMNTGLKIEVLANDIEHEQAMRNVRNYKENLRQGIK
tara:strand:- start:4414 stop:4857 length:444 start_codon:yes stop_codon:yes gene_type:complete